MHKLQKLYKIGHIHNQLHNESDPHFLSQFYYFMFLVL